MSFSMIERFGDDQHVQHLTLIAVILANISKLIRLVNASVQFIIIVGTPSPAPVHSNYVPPEQVAPPQVKTTPHQSPLTVLAACSNWLPETQEFLGALQIKPIK